MLSRILVALLAVALVIFSDPAEAQREGCWPSAFGGWQCSSNCRITACNDYFDGRGQIRKTCRFRCMPRQPQAFAPRPQYQQPVRRAEAPVAPRPQVRQLDPPSQYPATYQALWAMTPYLQFGIVLLMGTYILIARQGYFDVEPENRPSLGGMSVYLVILSFFLLAVSKDLAIVASYGWRGELTGAGLFFLSLCVAVIVLRFFKRFLMGWQYMFVAHPAAPAVNTAVAHNAPIDAASLRSALMPTTEELTGQPRKWAFQYKTEAAQAKALKEKLDADAAMARAAADRERARRARQET